MTGELYRIATDSEQYDDPKVGWENGGATLENPHRRHFLEYVEMVNPDWTDQTVLDIGTGSGWLIDHVMKQGAALATGFDPSRSNIELAKKYFKLNVFPATIDTYDSNGLTFDVAVAIYVLSHVSDLDSTFGNIASWLDIGGRFITIVPDMEYARKARADFEIQTELIEDDPGGAYVVRVNRDHGAIADIVRPVASYESAAAEHGLVLTSHIEMKPTHHLLESHPRYQEKVNTTLTHLLVFTKVGSKLDTEISES